MNTTVVRRSLLADGLEGLGFACAPVPNPLRRLALPSQLEGYLARGWRNTSVRTQVLGQTLYVLVRDTEENAP